LWAKKSIEITYVPKKIYSIAGDTDGLVWLAQYSDGDPIPYCDEHRVRLIRTCYGQTMSEQLRCPKNNEFFPSKYARSLSRPGAAGDIRYGQGCSIDGAGRQKMFNSLLSRHQNG